MNLRVFAISIALLVPWGALAQNENPYADLNKQVQEKLRAIGLYSGPVNGEFGFNTQAAVTQFQLSVPLPASGMLDDPTLAALGIQQPQAAASAGASGNPSAERAEASAPASSGGTAPATSTGN